MTASQPQQNVTKPIPANDKNVLEAHKVLTASSQHWASHGKAQIRTMLRYMAVFVALPTLLAVVYYGIIASDQYQTEMHISIRSGHAQATPSLMSTMAGNSTAIAQSLLDVRMLSDYVQSHDAVEKIDKEVNLRKIFSNPKADFISRMSPGVPMEKLVATYRNHVDVAFDIESGAAIVHVRVYDAADAKAIAASILKISEETVNSYNKRSEEDTLKLAREEVSRAEARMQEAREKITTFRAEHKDIDPIGKTNTVMPIIGTLETEYNKARVALSDLSYMSRDTAQVKAAQRHVNSLRTQIERERERLMGKGDTYARKISWMEALLVEQEIATKSYTSALNSMEAARMEATRQKSYVVPIVQPNMAESAEYPRRLRSIFLVFLSSLMIFGVGRLIVAGIRDHVMH